MADYNDLAKRVNEAVQAIKAKYEPRIAALQQRAQQLKEDFNTPDSSEVVTGIDFDVTWKDVEIIFDVPSVTMKDQSLKFDLPETTMKLQTFSWECLRSA